MNGMPRFWVARLTVASLFAFATSFVISPAGGDRSFAANECLAGQQFVPNQLVVGFKPGQGPMQLQDPNRVNAMFAAFAQAGVVGLAGPILRLPAGNIVLFDLRPGTDLCQAMPAIRAVSEVRFVEPNFLGGPPGGF
jgi:hypothetical protein